MDDCAAASWTLTTLGAVATRLVNGGTPPTENQAYWTGDIPWITGADFTRSGVGEFRRFVSKEATKRTATNVVDKGSLLIVTRTGVGKLAVAPWDIAISQDITGVYPDRDQVDVEFLYHRMRQGVDDLRKLNQGTSINGIVRNDLVSYPFELPPLNQQRRIATILSTVDQAIEQTEALIAKQERLKTGLMQDLLTRGIDENGNLRPSYDEAPELYQESELGWIPKEWRLTAVGSILSGIDAGKSPECPDKPTPAGEWGVLKVSAVQPSGFRSSENKIIENPRFVNPSYEVKDGDLLISRSNTYDLVGVVCLVHNPQAKLLLSDKTLRLRCNPDRIITLFLFQILQQHFVRRQIEINATGTSGSMKNISQPGIRGLRILLPPKQEQDRLSKCLYSIEDQMGSEQEHLAKLRRLKTALMQDLLTGKVSIAPLLTEEGRGE